MQTAQCLSATQFLGYISRQVCNIFCLFLQVFNETPSYSLSRNVSLLSRRERFWQQFSDTLTHARSLEAINAVDKQKGPKASSRSTCPFEIPERLTTCLHKQTNMKDRTETGQTWNLRQPFTSSWLNETSHVGLRSTQQCWNIFVKVSWVTSLQKSLSNCCLTKTSMSVALGLPIQSKFRGKPVDFSTISFSF